MRRRNRISWARRTAATVGVIALALSAIPIGAADGATDDDGDQTRAAPPGPELYRWLDRYGSVRYTPDLSRIPDSRRNTIIRVVPSTIPGSATLATQPGPPRA